MPLRLRNTHCFLVFLKDVVFQHLKIESNQEYEFATLFDEFQIQEIMECNYVWIVNLMRKIKSNLF